MLLIMVTILLTDFVGTLCTRKCTWSSSIPTSTKRISYRMDTPMHTSISIEDTLSLNTSRLYFEMIQKQRFVMMFVDMFTHAYNIAHIEAFLKPPRVGVLNPTE